MLSIFKPIFGSGNAVVLDSEFFVSEVITGIKAEGVYVTDLIKKRRYWPKGLPGDHIYNHLENK